MAQQRNPFTPTFGVVPPFMAGRDYLIDDVLGALDNGPGDPNLSTVFIGARGTGKTALLSYIASEAPAHGWIAVRVSATPGMLEDIYQQTQEAAAEFVSSSASPRLRGISLGQLFSVEWEPVPEQRANWRTRMTRLLKGLERYDIGLLIAIDEVRVTLEEMVSFAATYQLFVGEGRKVAVMMAGLPHQVSALLQDESISFLRRSVQQHLGRIADHEIERALRKTVEESGRSISSDALGEMVRASGGFPYMMQLVGYRVWNEDRAADEIALDDARAGIEMARGDMEQRIFSATYRELSNGDLRFLEAMLEDEGVSSMADIAQRMGVKANYAAQYRNRLLEQGVIGERGRGEVGFDIPLFDDYLRRLGG